MQGTPTVPFSALVRDTIEVHGLAWAVWHYRLNRKGPRLSALEFRIFAGI